MTYCWQGLCPKDGFSVISILPNTSGILKNFLLLEQDPEALVSLLPFSLCGYIFSMSDTGANFSIAGIKVYISAADIKYTNPVKLFTSFPNTDSGVNSGKWTLASVANR